MYVVKKGDTLYSIAKQHGTTYQDIAKDNGISNPNLIHPGQTLNIGGNSKTATQTSQDSTKTAAPAAAQPTAPATNATGGFEYGEYKPSDTVAQAEALLQQQMANKPGAYQSTWEGQLNDVISQILNREKFSYDLNEDALYQQYADRYIQQGKMAMMDAMGQAQSMTGGYGNSFAQSVGQQAYQGYLQQLNDIVPELYSMAQDQHNREGQALYDQAALMAQQEDQEYGRYRDQLTDYYTELDRMRDDARYQAETDYGRWADDRNFSYDNFINDRNYQYQQDRDAVSDRQWQTEFDEAKRRYDEQMGLTREQNNYDRLANMIASTGYAPKEEELKAAGMTETQAQSFKAAYENSLKTEKPKAVPDYVLERLQTYSTEDDMLNYLEKVVAGGSITEDQAMELLTQYAPDSPEEQAALTDRTWELADNGGVNWFWGIDENAKVQDQYGNTYRLDDLVDMLVEDGMTKSEAKGYVKALQKKLGA